MAPQTLKYERLRRPSPVGQLYVIVSYLALLYVVWTPFDTTVRGLGQFGALVGVGVAGTVMVVFLLFLLITRPRSGQDRALRYSIYGILLVLMLSMAIHGGIQGPSEYTGNFLPRAVLVLTALCVGYSIAERGSFPVRTAVLGSLAVLASLLFLMTASVVGGITIDVYRNQGVSPVGTPFGNPVQAYLIAYAVPVLFLIRSPLRRSAVYLLAVGMVALTFRRGPLVCIIIPVLLLPILDRRRESGRLWWLDVGLFVVVCLLAAVTLELDTLFVRWTGLINAESWALSERTAIYSTLSSEVLPWDWQTVFGHGLGSTVQVLASAMDREIFAHNDWLELLISAGVVGVVAFFLLHAALVSAVSSAVKYDRRLGFVAAVYYCQFFVSNWIEGMLYAAQHGAVLMLFLGAALGWTTRSERLN